LRSRKWLKLNKSKVLNAVNVRLVFCAYFNNKNTMVSVFPYGRKKRNSTFGKTSGVKLDLGSWTALCSHFDQFLIQHNHPSIHPNTHPPIKNNFCLFGFNHFYNLSFDLSI
jgi:hypothetical protein